MPSPFPGMDPYLEGSLWPDVNGSLIYTVRAALAASLPEGYLANIDQYVWQGDGEPEKLTRRGQPDAYVSNGPSPSRQTTRDTVAVAEPTAYVRLPMPKRVQRKRYIRLIDAEDRSVVTVIEPCHSICGLVSTRLTTSRDMALTSITQNRLIPLFAHPMPNGQANSRRSSPRSERNENSSIHDSESFCSPMPA
jgi:hypothetical protein